MKANVGSVKAVVTVSWKKGEEGIGTQSFEFVDGKMGTRPTHISTTSSNLLINL